MDRAEDGDPMTVPQSSTSRKTDTVTKCQATLAARRAGAVRTVALASQLSDDTLIGEVGLSHTPPNETAKVLFNLAKGWRLCQTPGEPYEVHVRNAYGWRVAARAKDGDDLRRYLRHSLPEALPYVANLK